MEVRAGEKEVLAKYPSRKQRQDAVFSLVMFPILVITALLAYNGFNNYFILGGIVLTGAIIGGIAKSYVPDKRKKENREKNSYTGLPQKQSKKIYTNGKSKKMHQANENPYNILPLEKLLIVNLKDMSGYDFEELCFQYFKHSYKYVEQTSYSKDKGVDFIFKDCDGFRVAVQVKHRFDSKNKVTLSEINQLNGARRSHNCNIGMFITSAGYTKDALNHAKDLHIETKEITWVENKIIPWKEKEAKKRKII